MKIYKITEASEYLGVSINTLKTLANIDFGGRRITIPELNERFEREKTATVKENLTAGKNNTK